MDQPADKIKYVTLIPGIDLSQDSFMEEAKKESFRSTDLRRSIGCIITCKDRIIGRGSNQATITWWWLNRLHVKRCIRKMLGIKKHAYYWICPGCALFKNHAEARAVKDIPTIGGCNNHEAYLYGHTYCCDRCIRSMMDININKIYINYE